MSTNETQTTASDVAEAFADPVGYLARFGIEAVLVTEPSPELAAAA